jgi:hypothetical protein
LSIVLKDILVSPTSTNTIANDNITMSNTDVTTYESEILIENPTTYSQIGISFEHITVGTIAQSKIKSQSGQTEYSASAVDSVNSLTGTKTLFTLGGGVLNTDTGTNGTIVATASQTTLTTSMNQAMNFDTGVGVVNYIANNVDATLASSEIKYLSGSVDVSTKTTSQSGQTELLARVENLATTQFCSRTNFTLANAIVDNHTSYSDTGVTPAKTVGIGTQINQTNALMSLGYGDNLLLITNQIQSISTASGSELKINAQDNNLSNTHEITIETPLSGDAIISHTVVGTARNLGISTAGNLTISADNIDLSSTGRLIVPSLASGDYLDYNTGKLTIVNDSVGGTANPLLVLQNNTTTANPVVLETYKNDTPTSTGGDNIASWSATCNTTILGVPTKTEISRINQIAYGVGPSNNDGGIALACKVNSAISNFLICNGGASSGEIQVFKPITAPSGNIELNATASTGTGDIFLTPNVATGSVKVSKDIITDSKIRNTDITASSIDFAGGSADYRFNMDTTRIELHYNNASTSLSTQQIFQDIINEEAYFKQTYTDLVGVNTLETILENDLTHHRIKLSETASGANCEITKDEIDIDDGGGLIMKLTPSTLQFNDAGVSIPLTIQSVSTPILLTSTGDITLTPTTSVVLNTQIQMPTTSGTISYSNITGRLSIDFASQSTGYFELGNLNPVSISGLTLTNGRIGGEYHILLRGQSGFSF